MRIKTTQNSDNAILQDLQYWYDPVGNVTFQRDDAQQTYFYNNSIAAPENDYTYDALYRLIRATGREHEGNSVGPDPDSWNDGNRIQLAHKHDETKMRPYVQYFEYDPVGNLIQQRHTTTNSSYNWTKNFSTDSGSNKLLNVTGAINEGYSYDQRGNIIDGFAHLQNITYNEANRLESVTDVSGLILTYYQYDAAGQRVRKVVENQNIGSIAVRKYVGSWEVYTRTDTTSTI